MREIVEVLDRPIDYLFWRAMLWGSTAEADAQAWVAVTIRIAAGTQSTMTGRGPWRSPSA
jgi:hypothetical protein